MVHEHLKNETTQKWEEKTIFLTIEMVVDGVVG